MLFWQEHAPVWSQSCQREEVAASLRHSEAIVAEPRGNAESPRLINQGRGLNQVIITTWQKKKDKKHNLKLIYLKGNQGWPTSQGGKNPRIWDSRGTHTHPSMQWCTSAAEGCRPGHEAKMTPWFWRNFLLPFFYFLVQIVSEINSLYENEFAVTMLLMWYYFF